MQDSLANVLASVYAETKRRFTTWSTSAEYRPFTNPPATAGDVGFAILYTPARYRPNLLIVGQNPSDFSDNGDPGAEPNGEMLSGSIPTRNSYLLDDHRFAKQLRKLFVGHRDLLASAVGMNVWYFQCTSGANGAPEPLRDYCAEATRTIVAAIGPRAVLCFGRPAFDALRGSDSGTIISGTKARRLSQRETEIWYVQHPTGARPPSVPAHDTPIVLTEIEAYLGRSSA